EVCVGDLGVHLEPQLRLPLRVVRELPGQVMAALLGRGEAEGQREIGELEPDAKPRGAQERAGVIVRVRLREDIVEQVFELRSGTSTKPPRPKRCRRYRSENCLPVPLAPSGKTITSSSSSRSRAALCPLAGTPPTLRMNAEMNGSTNAQSSTRKRAHRGRGC